MANTNKTKAEILQELESIKGLLLEDDDIPILQTLDDSHHVDEGITEPLVGIVNHSPYAAAEQPLTHHNPAVLQGQTSLFEDDLTTPSHAILDKNPGFASHLSSHKPSFGAAMETHAPRPLAKASGENPFLPQHIRERLHGNNPPPLFEYETAKKIVNATKNIANKINKPRQALVDEVIKGLMPQIEAELRHRLFAMSVEDLEKLLNEEEV